jgi:hypothetical protein
MQIAVDLAALMEIIVAISICWCLAKGQRGFRYVTKIALQHSNLVPFSFDPLKPK